MTQPDPKPGKQVVGDQVIKDMHKRMILGRERYGTFLETHNGRDSLQDLYEELIDATMYIKQRIIEEQDALGFVTEFNRLAGQVHQIAVDHGWWDEPRNDGEILMLMVTELAEACEALRHGNPPDDKIPEFTGVEAELADVIIRAMDYAVAKKLRLGEAVIAKMQFNASRPHKHGGKQF